MSIAWRRSSTPDRVGYAVAALLVLSGVVHLVVQVVLGGPWSGPVSWRKPVTFGLSFGITLATVTWVTSLLTSRRRGPLLAAFGAACVVEVLVITVQAWRRVPSHFNLSTPLNSAFAFTAAGGGAVIIVTSVAFAVLAFRAPGPPELRLALRAGFVTFLGTLGLGAAMIAIGTVAARTESQSAAYTAAAGLKSGHFALMHGILVLPLLARLAGRTSWPADRRLRVVALGVAGYVLGAGVVVVEAASGLDPLHAALPGVLALAGAGCLGVAGLRVLLALPGLRPGPHPSP